MDYWQHLDHEVVDDWDDLLDRLEAEPTFNGIDLKAELAPEKFVGRAPQQLDAFIGQVDDPIRKRYADTLGQSTELKV